MGGSGVQRVQGSRATLRRGGLGGFRVSSCLGGFECTNLSQDLTGENRTSSLKLRNRKMKTIPTKVGFGLGGHSDSNLLQIIPISTFFQYSVRFYTRVPPSM